MSTPDNNTIMALRTILDAVGGNPDQHYAEPFVPRGAQFGSSGLEVFSTPASPSINYATEPSQSTQILEPIFTSSYGMYEPQLDMITERRPMADANGPVIQYIEIDPPLPPEELAGGIAPMLATMSTRGYSVRPLQYGIGFKLAGTLKRDSRLDEAAWIVNEIGRRFAYWPEREMVRLVMNPLDWLAGTQMFLGADNERLFTSVAGNPHTYATSSESYALPAPTDASPTYVNTTPGTGSGANNRYVDETEVQADFNTARSTIISRTDAHGEPLIIEQPGGKWWAFCNTIEPTTYRFLYAAFVENANPSDDSLRDTQRFGVNVVQTQMLNGVGGTIGNDELGDWVLVYQAPGTRPPLFIVDRESLRTGYNQDPIADVEEWAWTQRHGAGYGDARSIQLIDATA